MNDPLGPTRLELLGGFSLSVEGAEAPVASRKARALIAYLARRGAPVTREALAGLLWGDRAEEQARASLRQALSAARKALGGAAAALEVGPQGVSLTLATDVAAFETALAADDLDGAVRLYRGEFLAGQSADPDFDLWAEAERAALSAAHVAARLKLLDRAEAAGADEEALAQARRVLEVDSLREDVHRRLMRALSRQKRHDAALKQYDALRALLDTELGVAPEAETEALAAEIRAARRRPPAGAAPRSAPAASGPDRPAIAVLPFRPLSADPEAGYFGEGVAEDVIIELSRGADLLVVSRQSSFRYDAEADLSEIGGALNVRYCLSGAVRKAGSRVRVSAHLSRCADGTEMWSDRYDRDFEDIFEIQSDIARTVTGAVLGRLSSPGAPETARKPEDMAAYDLVLRGLRRLHKYTEADNAEAEAYFRRALALDPNYARALGLLALSICYRVWYYEVDTEIPEAEEAARRAVALDPRNADAHLALGLVLVIGWRVEEARRHFETALAVNPNNDLALIEYARFLMYDGDPAQGVERVAEAMRLNPFHPYWYWNIRGRCLHLMARYDEAAEAFGRIVDPPFFVHVYLAACHAMAGRSGLAAEHRRRALAMRPGYRIEHHRRQMPYRDETAAARFFESLEAAGFN